MRLMMVLLALVLLAPATAARDMPVTYSVELTTPSQDCGDCVGVAVGAWAGVPQCCDFPAYSANAGAHHGNGSTTLSAMVCYSSFFYICYVDEQVTI